VLQRIRITIHLGETRADKVAEVIKARGLLGYGSPPSRTPRQSPVDPSSGWTRTWAAMARTDFFCVSRQPWFKPLIAHALS